MDSLEIVERYIVLLLGVKERPIPSELYLQKEIFLLSNLKKSLQEEFNFKKHYYGPFSQILKESLRSPSYLKDAFDFKNKEIFLAKNGKKEYSNMVKKYRKKKEFINVLTSLKLIREMYEKLNSEELLFLVYETYPEYTKFSKISDALIKNKNKRRKIIESIFSKSVITERRYQELKK